MALTKKQNEQLAEMLKVILMHCDLAVSEFGIDEMKDTMKNMREHASIAGALPFPATQNKADEFEIKNKLFQKFIELCEIRQKVMEQKKSEPRFSDGTDVLQKLGMI